MLLHASFKSFKMLRSNTKEKRSKEEEKEDDDDDEDEEWPWRFNLASQSWSSGEKIIRGFGTELRATSGRQHRSKHNQERMSTRLINQERPGNGTRMSYGRYGISLNLHVLLNKPPCA